MDETDIPPPKTTKNKTNNLALPNIPSPLHARPGALSIKSRWTRVKTTEFCHPKHSTYIATGHLPAEARNKIIKNEIPDKPGRLHSTPHPTTEYSNTTKTEHLSNTDGEPPNALRREDVHTHAPCTHVSCTLNTQLSCRICGSLAISTYEYSLRNSCYLSIMTTRRNQIEPPNSTHAEPVRSYQKVAL